MFNAGFICFLSILDLVMTAMFCVHVVLLCADQVGEQVGHRVTTHTVPDRQRLAVRPGKLEPSAKKGITVCARCA